MFSYLLVNLCFGSTEIFEDNLSAVLT